MKPHPQPMSAVDTAWLRMENDANLMVIGAVLILEDPVDLSLLKQRLQERLLKFDRFRQKVIRTNGKAYWIEDEHFHIDHHVHLIGLPGSDRREDLQQLAGDLVSTPLSFTHPLWQIQVVEKFQGGSALIFRIHHCIADGISLVRVMLSLTDIGAVPLPDEPEATQGHSLLGDLVAPAVHMLEQGLHLSQELLHEGIDLVEHPQHLLEVAREGTSVAAEIARIAALPTDPATCFKGALTGRKRVAWAESLPLAEVKHTAVTLGATINDVLLAATTGALRRYLLNHEAELAFEDLHVAVPFNLRPPDQPITQLGNHFGLVIVALPVGIYDVMSRFEKVRAAMVNLKKSYQAQVFYGLLGVLGKGPDILEQTALEVLSKKASLVMTNVPGPKHPLYLAGSKVKQPIFWVPQSGEVGVGLSILSYHESVQFGVVADAALIPDPQALVEGFVAALHELKHEAANHRQDIPFPPQSSQ